MIEIASKMGRRNDNSSDGNFLKMPWKQRYLTSILVNYSQTLKENIILFFVKLRLDRAFFFIQHILRIIAGVPTLKKIINCVNIVIIVSKTLKETFYS